MKLGISSYSLTWAIGVPGYDPPADPVTATLLIDIANAHQLQLVQIADNIPLYHMNGDELEQLKAKIVQCGVELELGTRGTDPEHMRQYLKLAEYFGCNLLRTIITTVDLSLAREQIQQVLPELEQAGVTIAIENHGLHTTKQLAEWFDSINHPLVGCCLDTVNSFSALDCPDRVITDLVPYIRNLHVKDFDITRIDHQMGFVIQGTAAGSGRLNIPDLLDKVRIHNDQISAILELWTPFTSSVEATIALEKQWFEQSLTYLKQWVY